MASLTLRNLGGDVEKALHRRAGRKGVSMESEARDILRAALIGEAEAPSESEDERRERVRQALLLGRRSEEPFDLKAFRDELWDFVE